MNLSLIKKLVFFMVSILSFSTFNSVFAQRIEYDVKPKVGFYNSTFCIYGKDVQHTSKDFEVILTGGGNIYAVKIIVENNYCVDENGLESGLVFTLPENIVSGKYTIELKNSSKIYPLYDTSFIYKDKIVIPYDLSLIAPELRGNLINSSTKINRNSLPNNFPKVPEKTFLPPLPLGTMVQIPNTQPIALPPNSIIRFPGGTPNISINGSTISLPPKTTIQRPGMPSIPLGAGATLILPTTPNFGRVITPILKISQLLSISSANFKDIELRFKDKISQFIQSKRLTLTVVDKNSTMDEAVIVLENSKPENLNSKLIYIQNILAKKYPNMFDIVYYNSNFYDKNIFNSGNACSNPMISLRLKKGKYLSGVKKIQLFKDFDNIAPLFGSDPVPRLDLPSFKTTSVMRPQFMQQTQNTTQEDYSDFRIAVVDSGISEIEGLNNNVEQGFDIISAVKQHSSNSNKIGSVLNIQQAQTYDDYVSQEIGHPDFGKQIGHGTAVATIISSLAPKTKLFPVKVCDENGKCSGFDTIMGICRIVIEQAKYKSGKGNLQFDAINFSLSTGQPSRLLNQVLLHAMRAGISVIASTGNIGRDCEYFQTSQTNKPDCVTGRRYPAYDSQRHKSDEINKKPRVAPDIPSLVTVGAVARMGFAKNEPSDAITDGLVIGEIGSDGQLYHMNPEGYFRLSGFSPDGGYSDESNLSWISLVAPGENILSVKMKNCNKTEYCFRAFTGTSFAAPWVSAAAIRLIKYNSKYRGNVQKIKKCLQDLAKYEYPAASILLPKLKLFSRNDKGLMQESSRLPTSGQNINELFGSGMVQMPDGMSGC